MAGFNEDDDSDDNEELLPRHEAEHKGSGAAVSTNAEHSAGLVCEQDHPLTKGLARTRLTCDSCGGVVKRGAGIFSCETCDVDRCERCAGISAQQEDDAGEGFDDNGLAEYTGGGDEDNVGGGGDAHGGGGGGESGSGRGRRQGRRAVSYAEPSEDDIYRGLPLGRGKRAAREHEHGPTSSTSASCCGHCAEPFPLESGVRKLTLGTACGEQPERGLCKKCAAVLLANVGDVPGEVDLEVAVTCLGLARPVGAAAHTWRARVENQTGRGRGRGRVRHGTVRHGIGRA